MSSPAAKWRWIAAFVLATAIAFSSALRAPLVYDDLATVGRNESIRSLRPLSAPLNPPPLTSVTGRPVVNYTFAINYAINDAMGVSQPPDAPGPNAYVGYHVGNVLLHLVCALLLFAILRRTLAAAAWTGRTLGAESLAGWVTLLWLAHPIQTATVDYITSRTELVVSAFLLGTLYSASRMWDSASRGRALAWLLLSTTLCALGMWSKEVMLAAPLIVLLYDRAFRSGSWRGLVSGVDRVVLYLALFATSAIVVQTVFAGARTASVGFDLGVTWSAYFYSQGWVIARYLRLILWPVGLLFDYGAQPITGLPPLPGFVLLAAAALGTVVAWTRQKWHGLAFIGAWFFILLAPSSSVIPISTEIGAERRVYLASAAPILLLLLGLDRVWPRLASSRRRADLLLCAVTIALIAGSFVRGRVYQSRTALYYDTIAKAPRNPRAFFTAGLAVHDAGPERRDEAVALLRKAIEIDPTYFDPWHYLGVIALAEDRAADAAAAFRRAASLRAGDPDANDGAARAFLRLGQIDSAAVYADHTGSYDVELLWLVSGELIDARRPANAIRLLERAQGARPSATAAALLAVAYAETGRPDEAMQAAASAVRAAQNDAAIHTLAARAALRANHPDLAREYSRRARELSSPR